MIGWAALTVQTSSRSPMERHRRLQLVPINERKIFDQWPECSTTRPMPCSTRCFTRSEDLVAYLAVAHVAPRGEHVGLSQDLFGQAVLGLVERGHPHHGPVPQVLGYTRGNRGVHAVWVQLLDRLVPLFVKVLPPHGDADQRARSCSTHLDLSLSDVLDATRP